VKKLFVLLAVLAAISFAQPGEAVPDPVATSPADAPVEPVATTITEPVVTTPAVETPTVATSPAEVEVDVDVEGEGEAVAGSAEGAQTQACMGGGGIMSFLPMIAIIVIFYFLMIRPQQKQAKKLREMRNAFQVNDRVVTSGGIHGVITNIKNEIITIRIADNVKIDVDRVALSIEGTPAGDSCSTCK
jgi:preprotein translocase subunit YajC